MGINGDRPRFFCPNFSFNTDWRDKAAPAG